MPEDRQVISPSRRRVVLGGASMLAASAVTPAFPGFAPPRTPELFVFPAAGSGRLIIAVAVAGEASGPRPTTHSPSQILIHASNRSWSFGLPADRATGPVMEFGAEHRAVAGILAEPSAPGQGNRSIVVLETDHATANEACRLDVWAEIFVRSGGRVRVGGPLMADIVARNHSLAARYHASSPALDRAVLSRAVADHAGRMAVGSVADPPAHGRHLAELLLPDVVTLHPGRPAGFTFASRNGRHPADNVAAVVSTILAGVPRPRTAATPLRLTDAFPYFQLRPATT